MIISLGIHYLCSLWDQHVKCRGLILPEEGNEQFFGSNQESHIGESILPTQKWNITVSQIQLYHRVKELLL